MTDSLPVEIEISLHHRDGLSWTAEARVDDPATGVVSAREGEIDLDLEHLASLEADPEGYASHLTEGFFVEPLTTSLAEARGSAARTGAPLRMRLRVGPSAPRLNAVRWELLLDPDAPDTSLVTQESFVFSRFLDSRDYRRVEVRPKVTMRALVAVAGAREASLADFEVDGRTFAPVDVPGEIARAKSALTASEVTTLGDTEPVTLNRLVEELQSVDVVYLVCHGYVKTRGRDRGPRLLLQNDDGNAAVVHGSELSQRMRELLTPPRLVVLASCMSADLATTNDDGALAAIGPELATAGVPAVIAMQGNVSMRTIELMMPEFFAEMASHGVIDRALAVARGHADAQGRDDWWMPVLFMRLKSGRLWYSPGFARGVDGWPLLLDQIEMGKLTPVIGPALTDPIIGSREELARTWAKAYKFPIPPPLDEDLPQVAQFVAKIHGNTFVREKLRRFVGNHIIRIHHSALTAELGEDRVEEIASRLGDPRSLHALVQEVGKLARKDPLESHKALASLPLPLYLTTCVGGLLTGAIAEDRRPIEEYFHWTDRNVWARPGLDDPAQLFGTQATPLVYQLFGDLRRPGSVVLSEDDYFEFLASFSAESKQHSIPGQVLEALVNSSLLFVGFRIDDWDFRVLFRAIMRLPGGDIRSDYKHVAVQVDPEASSQLSPEGVRQYLESYFGGDFTIYWGSSADFLRQLAVQWKARAS